MKNSPFERLQIIPDHLCGNTVGFVPGNVASGRSATTRKVARSDMAYDEDLANRIRALVTSFIGAEGGIDEKPMFGGLAFLVNGHMSVAASGGGGLMVRVAPEETQEALAGDHV